MMGTPNVKNTYNEGTKKFLVAQKILSGEQDPGKIAAEVGVKIDTVYVVKSELKRYMSEKASSKKEASGKGLLEGSSGKVTDKVTGKVPEGEIPPETIEMLRGEMTKVAKEELGRLLEGASDKVTGKVPEGGKLPAGVTPVGEEVEIIGEKINYKVALNPEIFFIYGIFKMEADRKGNKWGGDFSDFLYMAAKDILVAHGLRPAVISVKEGSLYRVSMEGS